MSGETLLNGRYRLVAQQGSGGMAVIYKAIDQALGRTVAIKILRPSLTADPAFITRFQNEARSIANLSHPNIVTVHDVGSDGPTHYIVMEFVEGQDLKRVIKTHGALGVERAVSIGISVCAGIGFAHRAGIVHADVKPQNVLLTKDDVVKITDFGIAQALTDTQPTQRQSVVWGSPHYFAPEQAQGEKPTAASDVYSIGIVIFEMLTGRLPYSGANQQELALAHIREPIPSAMEFNPAVPESLAKIIQKVMNKEPSQRYRMADQLGHILISFRDRGREQTVAGIRVEDKPDPTPPPARKPSRGQPPQSPSSRSHRQPAPREGALPTQRYNAAPDAPGPVNYGRSSVPAPADEEQRKSPPSPPPAARRPGDSGPLSPRFPYNQQIAEEESSFTLDGVTIALAILAFLAVACLIPLYIAVLQARLG